MVDAAAEGYHLSCWCPQLLSSERKPWLFVAGPTGVGCALAFLLAACGSEAEPEPIPDPTGQYVLLQINDVPLPAQEDSWTVIRDTLRVARLFPTDIDAILVESWIVEVQGVNGPEQVSRGALGRIGPVNGRLRIVDYGCLLGQAVCGPSRGPGATVDVEGDELTVNGPGARRRYRRISPVP